MKGLELKLLGSLCGVCQDPDRHTGGECIFLLFFPPNPHEMANIWTCMLVGNDYSIPFSHRG